ncbi:MAG TPA: uracil-DNA glycosylase, partial [Gammaproteobacteria bacterium]|nr:uracil-DNA glycosylase [Gammaproteobacteria bacterium]
KLQTPLIVTYHPAYLLRNPSDKGNAYKDLQAVAKKLANH